MKKNTQEKSMVLVNKNNVFFKIKIFLKNLLLKDIRFGSTHIEEKKNIVQENKKNDFVEGIKNIENNDTLILKFQKQYRRGEVKEEDMTDEQIKALIELYDKQIISLKKSNELRKRKLLEIKKK